MDQYHSIVIQKLEAFGVPDYCTVGVVVPECTSAKSQIILIFLSWNTLNGGTLKAPSLDHSFSSFLSVNVAIYAQIYWLFIYYMSGTALSEIVPDSDIQRALDAVLEW